MNYFASSFNTRKNINFYHGSEIYLRLINNNYNFHTYYDYIIQVVPRLKYNKR